MAKLIDKETKKLMGDISEQDLRFLIDHLEEEGEGDEDYYIDRDMLEFLKENGLPESLAKMIDTAIGTKEGIEITFEQS